MTENSASENPETENSASLPPLGMVGLGRMGANLMRRVVRAGGSGVVYDTSPNSGAELRDGLVAEGFNGAVAVASNLQDLADQLRSPRIVWVMVPSQVTGEVIADLAQHLDVGDIVIDGGNSDWRNDKARAEVLAAAGIELLDVGTSGGVWGLQRGYCLMVGGSPDAVRSAAPILEVIAPDSDSVYRTPGREGDPVPAEHGWLHCGPTGSGHFVKMVHNGIEYGLMAAYAEGLNVLGAAGDYGFDIDQASVTELWRRGSVIGSWLLDLTASAFAADPSMSKFTGHVDDSGEGRWTLETAVDLGVPMPVLASALFARFSSRGNANPADRILSAMRNEFGGHIELMSNQPTTNQ